MMVADEIRTRLDKAFEPDRLEVIDDSESHRGHAGYREGGQTHFNVSIKAPAFGPMTRIERHRAVHEALGKELVDKIHALALKIEA